MRLPGHFTDFENETLEIYETPSLMRTEMYAVVRKSDQSNFFNKENIRVAVNEGNTNYVMFLRDHFPNWMPVDLLKMDRSFIKNIEEDEKDRQMVGLILDIAKSLKLPVVAEGVLP